MPTLPLAIFKEIKISLSTIVLVLCVVFQRSCLVKGTPFTPKFSASRDAKVLNVHVVPHTHDDVGWLKTVEQYYYGFNSTIQRAHVQAILDSTIAALLRNPNRTFTYVEQRFFSMWWKEQSKELKEKTRSLVAEDRLTFVNGGWCMHDEAATHFMGMIDQTTLGHDFLQREFDFVPTIGWQLDPFGHSSSQASYMTSLMGFDALFFGRIDYQDLQIRLKTQECEGLWDASPNVGMPVFWGLTGSYGGNYGPPRGLCFDARCDDVPLVGLSDKHLLERMNDLVKGVKKQSDSTKGNHIMLTMGEDFNYENAEVYMKNIDVMIDKLLLYQDMKKIDIASVFESKFEYINIFYSNPVYYTKQKLAEKGRSGLKTGSPFNTWSLKTDDFFPYADSDHAYWTGYFTSRTAFKRFERVASSFLMAARQMESYGLSGIKNSTLSQPLFDLEDALGVAQHHDAVSGTAKQHVANDYAKRLQMGINKAASYMATIIKRTILQETSINSLKDFGFCQLLNETICDISESASKRGEDLYIVVYNGLASSRSVVIAVPVSSPGIYEVFKVENNGEGSIVSSESVPNDGKSLVYFSTGDLPPTGALTFKLVLKTRRAEQQHPRRSSKEMSLTNGIIRIDYNNYSEGAFRLVNHFDDSEIDFVQRWGYYTSFDSKNRTSRDQNSGAYIFRPSKPNETLHTIKATNVSRREISDLVDEIKIEYEFPWIEHYLRLYKGKSYVEMEYKIGPIPINDTVGKEVVTQYKCNIDNNGAFFTDSNGREFQKRVRSSRPTWKLNETEPIAGNFYPVNAAIYIEDSRKSFGIVTDRSQGASSLSDGSISMMVQRRVLADDSRGVGEPLNETDGCVSPYPPYGDATRHGEGVIVRGKHRLVTGLGSSGASITRKEMDEAFSEPLLFFYSADQGEEVLFRQTSFSLLQSVLPKNVMLLTFQLLRHEDANSFLIRLGHQYARDEHFELSKPVTVDLQKLFKSRIVDLVEKTLSGNRNREDWLSDRLKWTRYSQLKRIDQYNEQRDHTIILNPMEIRTFHIKLEATGAPASSSISEL
eukprot:CAMPEP_0194203020 /NCGR_PEP_ID=MMETSP0156-20130528/2917_1 /TAXON_ID=33649 /ORGANISM="Thalassionema nitzschioides, Strain L26-B" /LENGTH=1049 /DNA_ID=CAMNT_0038928679 /DNA_START=43 /DNA_END=3192 /DNA_ORIENTATION=-